MKKISSLLLIGAIALTTSCEKYLDINKNPNQATDATPELVLPQALTATANVLNGYNSYGAQLVGYSANAGGYGGFGSSITYNFVSGDFQARWSTSYDNLEDYQYIINSTNGKPEYSYFNAAARVMKSHGFQLLVDAYNDVPYFEALKGDQALTPKYDDAKLIYKDLADQLDSAISIFTAGESLTGVTPMTTSDVMFGGNITKWKQLANTIKLRLITRAGSKVDFSTGNKTFSSDGFLTTDALINPGYRRDNNRQNPKWNSWGFTYTGSDANKAWMPTKYILSFYNGGKLNDSARGAATYYKFPNTGTNQLGYENNTIESSPSGSFWYNSLDRKGSTAGNTTGPLKGPEAGYPVITAAESYFLQAEGVVRGTLTGDAKTLFENGIESSFRYTLTKPDGSVVGSVAAETAKYLASNASSPLVNFNLAASNDQKIEAIITQKYIALNFVNSEESWNEYRRTHYPRIVNGSSDGTQTFASLVSESTRPDKLPTRILYPTSEGAFNSSNVPKGISPFTSMIFWAL